MPLTPSTSSYLRHPLPSTLSYPYPSSSFILLTLALVTKRVIPRGLKD
jgi:hypothetical protein